MLARRILLYTAVLLLALTIASALTPRDDDGDDATTTTTPRAGSPSAPDRVDATFPAPDPVRVREGDIVEVTVKATEADRVAIEDLGIRGAVGPGLDAPIVFVADVPGTFPVTLRFTDRTIGTLTVRAR